MKRYLWSMLMVSVCLPLSLVAQSVQPTYWRGFLTIRNQEVPLEVMILKQGRRTSGVLLVRGDGQGHLKKIKLNEKQFKFTIPESKISFSGSLSANQQIASGTFQQRNNSAPLTLEAIRMPADKPEQIWHGYQHTKGMQLPIAFHWFQKADGEKMVFLEDLLRQKYYRANWVVREKGWEIEIPFINLSFKGTTTPSGNQTTGQWKQGEKQGVFSLGTGAYQHSSLQSEASKGTTQIPKTYQPINRHSQQRLVAFIEKMLEEAQFVGGELLVLQNQKQILQKTFGWHDRESGKPMADNAVYCIRSMTKPMVGTAVQMLIDEGRLDLETPVHQILPFFGKADKKEITLRHLLSHSSGLPFTTMGKGLGEYATIQDVAREASEAKLAFEPGSDFQYSDAGSDTLGAIVEKVSGIPIAQFIQTRLLNPLGMSESYPLIEANSQLTARIPTAYSGGTGSWLPHWDASRAPIFPLFLASQSMYTTTQDYARFLNLWLQQGTHEEKRLLSKSAVSRGLKPAFAMGSYPSQPDDLSIYYGQQWILYTQDQAEQPIRVAFGHDGSDGTFSWVWPQHQLMILFFTQSRNTMAGSALSKALPRLLFEQPSVVKVPDTAVNQDTSMLGGIFWDEHKEMEFLEIIPKGEGLVLEMPGRRTLVFQPHSKPGFFVHEVNNQVTLDFIKDAEKQVTGLRIISDHVVKLYPKHRPNPTLPSAEVLTQLLQQGHGMQQLKHAGVVALEGSVQFVTRNMQGSVRQWFDQERLRTELEIGQMRDVSVQNQDGAWTYSSTLGKEQLQGVRFEEVRASHPFVAMGDWPEHFQSVQVLKRIQTGKGRYLLVRLKGDLASSLAMLVDETTGRLVQSRTIVHVPGMGKIGVRSAFEDFREVNGITLPFKTRTKFATPLIGTIIFQYQSAKTQVTPKPKTFTIPH